MMSLDNFLYTLPYSKNRLNFLLIAMAKKDWEYVTCVVKEMN